MSADHDTVLGGRLRLRQPPKGAHRAGTDAILLARLLSPPPRAALCDLGSGPGVVGLAAAILGESLAVTLVERDPILATLARENANLNGIAARVVEADVLAPAAERQAAGLEPDAFDCVLTNPPYFEDGRYRPSPNPNRATAHGFGSDGLEGWLRTCVGILKPGGQLGMIHRADALPACLAAMQRRFGAVTVRPVHARPSDPAIRILVTATKGSRAPFSLLPWLVLHGPDGRFTPEVEALHGDIDSKTR